MSWAFGFVGNSLDDSFLDQLRGVVPGPLLNIKSSPRSVVLAGGTSQTCLSADNSYGSHLILGLGIQRSSGSCQFLSKRDWVEALDVEVPPLLSDGHFVVLRITDKRVECWTDRIGIRTLYIAKVKGGIAFSTRLDWLSKFTGFHEVDFGVFGSRWLTFNQISTTSIVKGITRLGPGGHAVIGPEQFEATSQSWVPDVGSGSVEGFVGGLEGLTNPQLATGQQLVLGLSGGIDSRTLLAIMRDRIAGMHAYTVGADDDPDVQIALKIGKKIDLTIERFTPSTLPMDESLVSMNEYAAQSCVAEPISSFLKLQHYPTLHTNGSIVIDGGFGEIFRRQYYNRLQMRGPGSLRDANIETVLRFIRVPRADVFSPDVQKAMERGTRDQLTEMVDGLTSVRDLHGEDMLDLLAIRSRFPNFGGYEQARTDNIGVVFTPFAQPSMLNYLFEIPLSQRKNGRLMRSLIRERWPALTKYPLAKGGVSVPFGLPRVSGWLWGKGMKMCGMGFRDTARLAFLENIKPFVIDLARSKETREFGAYDEAKVHTLVNGFYKGQLDLAGELDWWLAFEVWRRGLSGK